MGNGLIFPCHPDSVEASEDAVRRAGGALTVSVACLGVPQGTWGWANAVLSGCSSKGGREKPDVEDPGDRTKTDTGRRGEYPQALGKTVRKELGKMAP